MSFQASPLEGLTDSQRVSELTKYLKEEVKHEQDPLALMANMSAALMFYLDRINWAGFYMVRGQELLLGPFQGLPACSRLQWGRGVCAEAWQTQATVCVADVQAFPGHIACDSASRSELVIPLMSGGEVYAVLDIDSPELNRFADIEAPLTELGRFMESYLYWGASAAEQSTAAPTKTPAVEIHYELTTPQNFDQVLALYEAVGWTNYTDQADRLQQGLSQSQYVIAAYDGTHLVGLLRAISDYQTILYVQDILVHPAYQRQGIGTELFQRLLDQAGKIYQVVLTTDATAKNQSYYQSLGLQAFDTLGCQGYLRMND